MPTTSEPPDPESTGGCGSALAILFGFVGFAVIMVWLGIATTNLALYFAGLPVSGLVSLFGSDLILAWPLDSILWISAAWMVGSRVTPTRYVRAVLIVLLVALTYGYVLSQFIEPTGPLL